MKSFAYDRPDTVSAALEALDGGADVLAGGTTMIDLMKLGVRAPDRLVDITALPGLDAIAVEADGLRFGALARMADAADDAALRDACPAMTESLWKAASPQLRHAARLGGNLLQRTRCPYFRDVAYRQCNKRDPGSGCAMLDGGHAGLGALLGASDACAASYPGDWAASLIAFDATVRTRSAGGGREIALADLHRRPGDSPHVETVLENDELIVEIVVPRVPAMRASHYLKARERESYAFAAASAAVGLEMDGDAVRDARIALGGVATTPWRAREAEEFLRGQALTEDAAREAGRIAYADAQPLEGAQWKVALGADVVAGALMTALSRANGGQ
jgi:xanthine dehydrogenase YagS FAD-binding subunit